jgi:uncharacterized protein (TIGR01244 family)
MREVEPGIFVAGQVAPDEVAALAGTIATIVNNRPDGEEAGQPPGAGIEAAARAAGLTYRAIPISGGFTEADVSAMAEALEQAPVLAFCRSGTRSTYLWALARRRHGAPADELIAKAAAAGYDLGPIARLLHQPTR